MGLYNYYEVIACMFSLMHMLCLIFIFALAFDSILFLLAEKFLLKVIPRYGWLLSVASGVC